MGIKLTVAGRAALATCPGLRFLGEITMRLVPLVLIVWAVLAGPAGGAENKSDYTPEQALDYSQAALGRYVGNYTLTDSTGAAVRMADFHGKPVVVSFIYTSCADSCPVITQTLAEAAEVARNALGNDSFSVISIGFDSSSDSPDRMRYFAKQQDINLDGWKFLSGDLPTVLALANDLGFIFYRSPKGFDHLSQVSVISGDGTVYRQIYGQTFETPLLVEPLKELVFGTEAPFASLGDLLNKVRLFCTIYDPAADRYRFDYSIFIKLIVGTLIVGGMGVFVTREWWRIWRTSRRKKIELAAKNNPSGTPS